MPREESDEGDSEGWTHYGPSGDDAPIPRCAICGLSAVVPPGPQDPRFTVSSYGALCELCAERSHEAFKRWEAREPRDVKPPGL